MDITPLRLDLGCGKNKRPGFIGVDILNIPGVVDVVHDLSLFPWPFEEDSVEEVWLDNILEHFSNPIRIMEEVYRICRNKAIVHVRVPYFRSFYAMIDPTHSTFFTYHSFDYFDPNTKIGEKYRYTSAIFHILDIRFDPEWLGKRKPIHAFFVQLAQVKPDLYERLFSHLYPLNSLEFNLVVEKLKSS